MALAPEKVFEALKDLCLGIYLGGSQVDPAIIHPHDADYIMFAKQYCRSFVMTELWGPNSSLRNLEQAEAGSSTLVQASPRADFSQCRAHPYTQITWFSYLDPLMKPVVGEDVCPKTDVIQEHRQEFISCLQTKVDELLVKGAETQKRWYHLLRGAYILINNSYEVSEEQKIEINKLHDLSEGWEAVRDKTIELVKSLQ